MTSSLTTARFPAGIRLADVDDDDNLDILCGAACAGQVALHRGSGTGTFGAVETFDTGSDSGPASLAVGDLNADSAPDVFVVLSAVEQATVLPACPH